MKIVRTVLIIVTLPGLFFNSCKTSTQNSSLISYMDTISYCVGVYFGSNLHKDGFDTINTKLVGQGLSDLIDMNKPMINKEDAKKILYNYRAQIQQRHLLEKFGDNKVDGEKFLKENKKQKGVVTLPSGLQYKILKKGPGPQPGPKDLVFVHYKGQLIDGTVFEDHEKGKPVVFGVNRVITGWKEALQLMHNGAKWRIYVPYQLGYGTQYQPNSPIVPYSALIFDIELVKIRHE